jgi:hypothetical protein
LEILRRDVSEVLMQRSGKRPEAKQDTGHKI